MSDRMALTTTELAQELDISIKAARRLVADGTIPSVRLAERTVRVSRDALASFLTSSGKPVST